jgi:hypothetical protein
MSFCILSFAGEALLKIGSLIKLTYLTSLLNVYSSPSDSNFRNKDRIYQNQGCKIKPLSMKDKTPATATEITPEYLSGFSETQLTDLLSHRLNILIAVTNISVKDKEYIDSLHREIEIIQAEINRRKK